MGDGDDRQDVAILHVSDTLFGPGQRFAPSHPAAEMVADLRGLLTGGIPAIDLIIHSGDIAARGMRSEYDEARSFVDGLCGVTGLDHDRVITVPGERDVNAAMSRSYFDECEAEETEPLPPYARKWRQYQQFVTWLHGAAAFTEDQPYRVHRFDDLRLTVAALNSTIRDSHRPDDHYGWCGAEQLRWAARRLTDDADHLRLAVLHHHATERPPTGAEDLRDVNALTRHLGPALDLVLHGHAEHGAPDRLTDGTLVLATGSYQVVRLSGDRVARWARRWDAGQAKWVGDTRIGVDGRRWQMEVPPGRSPAADGWRKTRRTGAKPPGPVSDFVSQVEFVTRRDLGDGCPVERRSTADGLEYLIAIRPAAPLRCIAVVDRSLDAAVLDECEVVFAPLRERGGADLVMVHHGPQEPDLRRLGQDRGVRVKTWTEYNDLLDASAYRVWLRDELDRDPLYPQALYLEQRYRAIDRWGTAATETRDHLVQTIYQGLLEEEGQFFLVLGDAGYGKSFLVRRLAHLVLDNKRAGITPVVIYLRDRDKRQTIEEMVSNVLIGSRSPFNADRFQHSLQAGTIALLIDGYDEFAVRVGYQNAADQLKTFIDALQGRAKIVLTTRPNHFRSTDEATSALFASLRSVHHGSVYQLEPFDHDQQEAFLDRWFRLAGDPDPAGLAKRWMATLAGVDNLPELARTPRMLSFMAQDLSLSSIEAAAGSGTVTAADLYQKLIDLWLGAETNKVNPLDERNVPAGQRQRMLEEIAMNLWRIGERDVTENALQNLARDSLDLPRIEMTVDQAAQLIGGRTLLQVDARRWRFAHQSVWEFLLANSLARRLRAGTDLRQLGDAQLTQLTIRFLRDLAPAEAAAWAKRIADG